MADAAETIIRGRCRCGQRYRIRHARAGRVVHCPKCGRPIIIRDEDITAASSGLPLAPDQPESPPLDAVPLDGGDLKLAPSDALPGLSGKRVFPTDDVAAASAGIKPSFPDHAPAAGDPWAGPGSGGMLLDLLRGFALGGRPGNLIQIGWTTLACTVALWVLNAAPFLMMFALGWVAFLATLAYVVRFLWGVLVLAANGEDDLRTLSGDWSWVQDAILPTIWLAVFTVVALVPSWLVRWYVPDSLTIKPTLVACALALGVFFWPAMIMAAGMGRPGYAIRPDILVRAVVAIGPAYLLAWAMVIAGFVIWLGMVWVVGWLHAHTPVPGFLLLLIATFAEIYGGYVVFHSLGVIYYHRSHRMPW